MRMIDYDISGDAVDEYVRMGESTVIKCVKEFAKSVVECYKYTYLKPPSHSETILLLQRSEQLGFPGLFGSIDYCKWKWKN